MFLEADVLVGVAGGSIAGFVEEFDFAGVDFDEPLDGPPFLRSWSLRQWRI